MIKIIDKIFTFGFYLLSVLLSQVLLWQVNESNHVPKIEHNYDITYGTSVSQVLYSGCYVSLG